VACPGHPDHTAAAVAVWSFLHGYVTLDMVGSTRERAAEGVTGGVGEHEFFSSQSSQLRA
jgi:hypothetical protein